MNSTRREKALNFAVKKFKERNRKLVSNTVSQKTLTLLKQDFLKGINDTEGYRIRFSLNDNGEIDYFIFCSIEEMPEYQEKFITFSHLYCSRTSSVRRKFYKEIRSLGHEISKQFKVSNICLQCFSDDDLTKQYYQNKGSLNWINLYGVPKKSLSLLKKIYKKDERVEIKSLQKKDCKYLARIERSAHLKDKSSRLYINARMTNSVEGFEKFYAWLYKNHHCLVAYINNKPVAAIGFIKSKDSSFILNVFVEPRHHGEGIGKKLYLEYLKVLNDENIKQYIGFSSTSRVLRLAKKMERRELKRAYHINIKDL